MTKEKNGIFVLMDIILALLIVATLAAIVFLLIKTNFSYAGTEEGIARPEVVSCDQNAPWEARISGEDIIAERENRISEQEETASDADDYIFPDSDSRYLEESEIRKLTQEEMRLARNEIYARHGRIFKDETLNEYFLTKDWYTPIYSPEEMDALGDTVFNEYEYYNKNLIAEIEEDLGYR